MTGYNLELLATPQQQRIPKGIPVAAEMEPVMEEEIQRLSTMQAIRRVTAQQDQYVSQLFLVPKKDGTQRPVVNLKPLNRFIRKQKFKMEGARSIRDVIQEGDWMATLDLKDAYLSVPICESHRRYLRFVWKEQLYEFTCLPFGLCSAPRVFTKLLKPVVSLLRQRGMRCLIYLDDILLMSQAKADLEVLVKEVLFILQNLGFRINWKKSRLLPSQRVVHPGVCVNDDLPAGRQSEETCPTVSDSIAVSFRELARLIGTMTATSLAVLPAPLCFRGLQSLKNQVFAQTQSFETMIMLNETSREELRWWSRELQVWNGRPIRAPAPDMTIETDASLLGWGAVSEGTSMGGLWSEDERSHHINLLELMGGDFATRVFARDRQDIHIHLRMDNTTAIAYVNHMGGTRSQTLSQAACKLWQWCLSRGITLSAEHLPGAVNTIADQESRTLRTSTEWMLDRTVFQGVMGRLGPCTIDLFASRLNNQLLWYVCWLPDPFATATDALQMPWQGELGYAFPPFALVGRCLQKVKRDSCSLVLITPVWSTQHLYPELLTDYPLLLPQEPTLLRDPFNNPHPMLQRQQLQLAAWKVSGLTTQQRAFQDELQRSSCRAGVREPIPLTSRDGTNGVAGAWRGVQIPFHVI